MMQETTSPQPTNRRRAPVTLLVVTVIAVALVVIGTYISSQRAAAPTDTTPTIANVQIGTYATTTKSITAEKTVFNTKETIGLRGEVRNIPDHSSLLILMQSTDTNQNYCMGQIPNTNPITKDNFHFTCGQERPVGNYTILLELFGSDKQQIGEKVIKEFTVR